MDDSSCRKDSYPMTEVMVTWFPEMRRSVKCYKVSMYRMNSWSVMLVVRTYLYRGFLTQFVTFCRGCCRASHSCAWLSVIDSSGSRAVDSSTC